MNDIQNYLQDLLTIDCEIQINLQHLLLVTTREALESESNELKRSLKEFKNALNEMKDFCESYNSNTNANGLISRLAQSSTVSNTREMFFNEYQIQKEHLSTIEARYRNAYLAAQNKLDQLERETLMSANLNNDSTELKKRNLSNQLLLKQNNEMTSKLHEINRQLKWIDNQTGDIIPVLDESSKSLKNVQQEFGLMRVVINDGKRLLVRLNRREFTDKLLIFLCLCFFFSVVFYIIWKRVF
jgi:hypothetical protein